MNVVQEQLDAYNARDLERFLACYAENVVVAGADGAAMMTGLEEMRAVYSALFANSPNLRAELGARFQAGRYVVDEERVSV
ncbi:nuclear transport factor 2 family protein [Lysobacter claricitrinus]|uniref:nuclear transport factor 2 family protein n=1 Tax=Lysobacter claricitrinus TaxID=3367728 RepID=UPI0037DB3780